MTSRRRGGAAERSRRADEYVQRPSPSTTLVLAASDIDKSRKLGKALYKHATVVECWGLKTEKNRASSIFARPRGWRSRW